MIDRTERHPSDERLSAYLDGDAGEPASHLDTCGPCQERLGFMREARQLMASPVAELDEATDSALVAAALANFGAQRPHDAHVPAADRARRGHRVPLIARVAAVTLVLGLAAAGITLAAHHRQPTASAGASAAINGQKAATAAAQKQAFAARTRAAGGRPVAAQGSFATAVLEMRPLLRLEPRPCSNSGVSAANGEVEVAVPAGAAYGDICLLLGKVLAAAWRPARITIAPAAAGDDAVSLPLTIGAADVLERSGLRATAGSVLPAVPPVPPVSAWKVVALRGRSFVGDVSLVLDSASSATPSYSVLIVGLSPQAARSLGGALAS